MNPDLIRAARLVYLAQQRASAAGVSLTPADLDAYVREETKGQYTLDDAQAYLSKHMTTFDPGITPRNVGRSLAQGALGDWADELLGKLPEAIGGGQGAEEEMRLNQAIYHNAHPTADTIGKVAGGVGAGVALGAAAPEIAILSRVLPEAGTVAGAAARAAAGGAAFGAVSGAGEGETASERRRGAARGAATGAVAGGVLGGAAGAATRLVSPAAKAARRLANAVEESGGVDALKASNAALAAAGRGKDVIAGDLSPATQMLTRFAANNNPNTYVRAAEKLNARQPNMSERLLDDTEDLLRGGKIWPEATTDAGARAEELAKSKAAFAASDEGYEGLRKAGVTFKPSEIAPFLSEPSVKAAWRLARRAGDITNGSPLDDLFETMSNPVLEVARGASSKAGGKVPRAVTFEDMHQFKQLLDDKAATAFRSGQGSLGKAYATVRDAVRQAMIEKVPGYAVVDAKYVAMSRLETMLQQGVESFNRTGVRELASDVAQMSPEELAQFRHGLASKLVDSLRDAQTNRDAAKRLMDASVSMQEKLKVIFGDEATFNQFMSRVKAESQMAKTKAAIGGSQTHLLGADAEFDPLPHVPGVVTHGPLGLLTGLMHHTLGRASKNQTSKAAALVGDKMLTQGSTSIDKLLQELSKPEPLLNARFTGGLSGLSGLLFH